MPINNNNDYVILHNSIHYNSLPQQQKNCQLQIQQKQNISKSSQNRSNQLVRKTK